MELELQYTDIRYCNRQYLSAVRMTGVSSGCNFRVMSAYALTTKVLFPRKIISIEDSDLYYRKY